MMLREEFRRPLDEVRAKEGTKAYLQMTRRPVSTGTVWTEGEEEVIMDFRFWILD